ncbi:isochorismatase family protein [Isoalcanivorax beigongshangi]|uniref:isochorismatase n=1 Tax=Isoalcanivorax beigongshangi TaxID=3238810 RepID=A0ABV4AHZ8_9GAMM
MSLPHQIDYPMPAPAEFPAGRTNWPLEPARAALLIHDMQRYFLRGYPAGSTLRQQLIGNLVQLRQWARRHGMPVIYTAQPHQQPAADRALLNDFWGAGLPAAAAAEQAIVAELAPDSTDLVLDKWRYSAFQRSDLLTLLGERQRDQLIIGGVYAHIGCMATALEAFMHDIQPFLVGDAVADFSAAEHRMALDYVAGRCGQVTSTAALLAAQPFSLPSRDWLHQRVAQLVEDSDELDPDESLIYYGLDSLRVMQLAAELSERGIRVSFEELAQAPTLNQWWQLLQQRQAAAS